MGCGASNVSAAAPAPPEEPAPAAAAPAPSEKPAPAAAASAPPEEPAPATAASSSQPDEHNPNPLTSLPAPHLVDPRLASLQAARDAADAALLETAWYGSVAQV